MRKLFLVSLFVCLGVMQAMAQSFTYTDENGTWECTVLSAEEKTVSINRKFEPGPEVIIPSVVSDGTEEYTVTELVNSSDFFHYTDEKGFRYRRIERTPKTPYLRRFG